MLLLVRLSEKPTIKYRIYCNKRPGAMHFSKGGATITDK